MRIFVATGIVLEGDELLNISINHMIHRTRYVFQRHLDARNAGDFGEMIRLELQANDYSEWWHEMVSHYSACDVPREAITRFLERERRYIHDRTERCDLCWYGKGNPPEGMRRDAWPRRQAVGYFPKAAWQIRRELRRASSLAVSEPAQSR